MRVPSEDKTRPDSASSSATSSSSDLEFNHLSTGRTEEKCGYDKVDMSFILGDTEQEGVDQRTESEAASLRQRRQFRRQFGMTPGSTEQCFRGEKDLKYPLINKDDDVEVVHKAILSDGTDMETDDMDICDDDEDNVEDEPETGTHTTGNSEEGWITDEEVPELPPKRIKTSNTDSDSNSDSSDEEEESSGSDSEQKNDSDGSDIDMSAFFDSNDPVYSYPSGPIKMTMKEIADYKQEECGGSRYYNFGSEDMGFDDYFDSLANQCESEDDDDDYFCMTCFSMSAGQTYAFPRVTPRRIEQLVKFWEKDFQVGSFVYPKMGSWESKGIEPNRNEDPASDCRKYSAFKVLYRKWLECNQSREQWYRRYRGHSLVDIANGRVETCVQKQKTDSTFRNLCPVDIAAQCWSQSQVFRRRQRSSAHRPSPTGDLLSTIVF